MTSPGPEAGGSRAKALGGEDGRPPGVGAGGARLWLEPCWVQGVLSCTAILHSGQGLQAFSTCPNPHTQTTGSSLPGLRKVCGRKVPTCPGTVVSPLGGLSKPPAPLDCVLC